MHGSVKIRQRQLSLLLWRNVLFLTVNNILHSDTTFLVLLYTKRCVFLHKTNTQLKVMLLFTDRDTPVVPQNIRYCFEFFQVTLLKLFIALAHIFVSKPSGLITTESTSLCMTTHVCLNTKRNVVYLCIKINITRQNSDKVYSVSSVIMCWGFKWMRVCGCWPVFHCPQTNAMRNYCSCFLSSITGTHSDAWDQKHINLHH